MRRPLLIGSVIAAGLIMTATPAAAQPPPNGAHNCAGFFVSGVAGPAFGPAVAALAALQGVDDVGLANCGAHGPR
jgi:hypothetical protein